LVAGNTLAAAFCGENIGAFRPPSISTKEKRMLVGKPGIDPELSEKGVWGPLYGNFMCNSRPVEKKVVPWASPRPSLA